MAANLELTVSQLNEYVRRMFQMDPMLRAIELKGEISNLKFHQSGALFFTMKDENASISCVMYSGDVDGLQAMPFEGMRAVASGSVALYVRGGQCQFVVKRMRAQGVGVLYERLQMLKEKLGREGLFEPERKRALPPYPDTIGVVSSPTGAVIHDILNVSLRRNPDAHILLCPVRVQGIGADEEVVEAIHLLERLEHVSVIIVARGGGSMEDLWAFNEEVTARAIYASEIPVISAVGHEPDVTIADFVADLRAPTPSGAAELAVPDRADWKATLEMLDARLRAAAGKQTETRRRQLQSLSERLSVRTPVRYIAEKRLVLDTLTERLQGTVPARLAHERQQLRTAQDRLLAAGRGNLHRARLRFTQTVASLDAMSPLRVLSRGYAVATKGARGAVVTDAAALKEGDALHIRFAKGAADCRVIHTEEEQ